MDSTRLKILLRAESIIQRDAIIAALENAGITTVSAPRDISRKIADSTVDLAYEGYSAIFDGFPIQVPEDQFVEAERIANTVLFKAQNYTDLDDDSNDRHIRKFYFCALSSMFAPLILHPAALYHMRKALRNGEKFSWLGVIFANLWLLITDFVGFEIAKSFLERFIEGIK